MTFRYPAPPILHFFFDVLQTCSVGAGSYRSYYISDVSQTKPARAHYQASSLSRKSLSNGRIYADFSQHITLKLMLKLPENVTIESKMCISFLIKCNQRVAHITLPTQGRWVRNDFYYSPAYLLA